jgi:hypothetical protein
MEIESTWKLLGYDPQDNFLEESLMNSLGIMFSM